MLLDKNQPDCARLGQGVCFWTNSIQKIPILTSKAIQKNFFEATYRRKDFEIEYIKCLLTEIPGSKMNRKNVCKNGEIACKNAKNADIFQQRREEKNREEKSKEETTTCSRACEGETKYSFPDLCERFRAE